MPCVSGDLSPLISRLRDKLLAVFFPPKGKPSLHYANMANMALHCGLPLRSALTSRLRDKLLAVFFHPKGKPSLRCANMANSCVYIANKNANIANKNLRASRITRVNRLVIFCLPYLL